MSTSAEHDRGWVLTRALAFIFVFFLRIAFAFLGCFSLTCMLAADGLERLQDRLRPPADLDPATDLRYFYSEES